MKTTELNVLPAKFLEGPSRREMVRWLMGGIGAGLAWPILSAGHPMHEHLADGALLDRADAELPAANWKPLFLSAEQNNSLVALAEQIVPGSTKAQVNRFIDLLLSVDTAKNRQTFLKALAGIDSEAKRKFGKSFAGLRPEQQTSLLTSASSESAEGYSKDLNEHFEHLKSWISGAYYSSEIGMRELGWTENRVFEKLPECMHPEGHS